VWAKTVAREFSYSELSAATSNFSKDRELGAGSFGIVYRGELQDTRMVAVKKLTTTLLDQTRIRGDFVTEIKTLGQLSHRNLVKLLGWCSGRELLLVYELVTNGSLEEHLHMPDLLLAWPERYKIVLGVGAAIDYLHNGCRNSILHRDIKPSNVMLDDAFDAKLGDFGLVRQLVDTGHGQSSLGGTLMIGTREYMDPVCIRTDTVSTASDMYSFGVLLLEIAAGVKPAVQRAPPGGQHLSTNTLVEAVREAYARGAVLDMADKRLSGNFDSSQMERVLAVGLLCVELERRHRPNIKRAVNLLSDLSLPVDGR
jgi:interleukin-1 receptor-associated kinase 1